MVLRRDPARGRRDTTRAAVGRCPADRQPMETRMRLLKPILSRDRKLTLAITAELKPDEIDTVPLVNPATPEGWAAV